ncbi:UDP-glycosyltransferase 92A1-like protein [Cinnamomum micranthum f. kanehirae]|uniref:UDP-glycosyltransferase 92A1-like protein n=1 Tax=Cinnamomum micranthum f. kanehirae TaxID=337451 RepID=A0A3S3NJP8_9MAGN|nr:UDP-glycosyltransferase 92A1-like protein [Cinnamomum micranthum f. kanehirae]
MELAMGLEESGKAFIWAIRPPLGNDFNGEFRAEWLPEGFEERVVLNHYLGHSVSCIDIGTQSG